MCSPAMALYDFGIGLNLGHGDRPESVKGMHVSADYFKVFGFSPLAGRTFTSAEDLPSGPKVALISQRLWQSHHAGDPAVIGRTIELNGDSYTVIGIMPASFPSPIPRPTYGCRSKPIRIAQTRAITCPWPDG